MTMGHRASKERAVVADANLDHIPDVKPQPEEPLSDADHSSAEMALRHAGTWIGDDLETLVDEVFAVRGPADF